MSDPNAPSLDVPRIIEVLDRHGVEYVLVGGLGAQLHGASRQTMDFDACPRWSTANLGRLAAALRALDARLKVPDLPEGLQLPSVTEKTLTAMEVSTWRTAAGDVDVLLGIPRDSRWSLNRFESLRERAHRREVAGCTLYVADLADIIASKRVADRPPDRAALPELEALAGQVLDPPGADPPELHLPPTPSGPVPKATQPADTPPAGTGPAGAGLQPIGNCATPGPGCGRVLVGGPAPALDCRETPLYHSSPSTGQSS